MLHTTRQYVEVLATYVPSGDLRTTRQYTEVLGEWEPVVYNESLSNTISLGQSIYRIQDISVNNTINLNHILEAARAYSLESTLSVGQILVCHHVIDEDIVSTIDLDQELEVTALHNLSLSNAIQSVTQIYNPVTQTLDNIITGLNQSVSSSHTSATPTGFHQAIQLRNHVNAVLLKSTAIDISVSNSLSLDQDLFKNQVGQGINTIQFGQILDVDYCKPVSSDILVSNSVSFIANRKRGASSSINLGQSFTYIILRTGIEYQYHPFVGAGASGPPVTLNAPMPGITAQFQLVYPAEGTVTDSVSLRSPDFGNKDQLAFNRISRETRGGTLIVYADPIWPKIETLVLSFSALHRNVAQALLTFLDSYLGQEVGLIDWEHRYWKGIIITPENSVIEDSKDSFSASFSFEGEMDPTWTPQVIPVLQGTPLIPRIPEFSEYCEELEPISAPVAPSNSYYAVADQTMAAGQVVYVESSGHVALAMSDAMPEAGAIGLLFANIGIGGTATYMTEESITLADWTVITGTVSLTPGALYWLSNSVAGGLSDVAPTTGYVVQIGRATSATTFDIEIEESIRL
jgi:hypothetical protein